MQNLDSLRVTAELHASVRRLVDRLGRVRVETRPRWQHVVSQLDFESVGAAAAGADTAVVVVGSPADVLNHARTATDDFGFVMSVAQIVTSPISRMRQGAHAWRDDATLDLWQLGWSPLNIDRILVPAGHVVLECVIGDARPVPEVQVSDV